MNFFKRLFKIGQSEVNSSVDKMEDPIKMTEQGIRDLREDLVKGNDSLAQVKALSIRAKNEIDELKAKTLDYEQKAMLILKKVEKKDLSSEEADNLAKDALIKKAEVEAKINELGNQAIQFDESVEKIKLGVHRIKENINKWENELRTLRARVKVTNATQNLNKHMADIDNSSTVSMLERMKEKVAQEEALTEAYSEIADTSKSVDDRLNEVVDSKEINAENSLNELKTKLGL